MPPAETMHDEGLSVARPNGHINGASHINLHTIEDSTSSASKSASTLKMVGQKMFSEAGPKDHALRIAKGLSLEEQV